MFWQHYGSTFAAIVDLLASHSVDGSGEGARDETTERAQKKYDERVSLMNRALGGDFVTPYRDRGHIVLVFLPLPCITTHVYSAGGP